MGDIASRVVLDVVFASFNNMVKKAVGVRDEQDLQIGI
jgi:hypothetical protein